MMYRCPRKERKKLFRKKIMPKKSKIIKNPSDVSPGTLTEIGDKSQGEELLLSPEEMAFVNYLFEENMNRTRAYQRGHPDLSRESAAASASRMLKRVNVSEAVARRLADEAVSPEEGIYRLSRIARGTVMPFLREGSDGFMYFDLSHPDAKENMFLIKDIETKRERRISGSGEAAEEWEGEWVKVKLHDAYTANVDLLKIHGKFIKKVDLSSGGEPIKPVDNAGFDRSLTSFLDAIREVVSGNNSQSDGKVETTK